MYVYYVLHTLKQVSVYLIYLILYVVLSIKNRDIFLISLILELTLLVNIWPDFVYFGCCIHMYTCNVGYQIVTDLFVCLLYFSYFLLRVLYFFSFFLFILLINIIIVAFGLILTGIIYIVYDFFFVVNVLKMGLCELLNY